MSSSTLVIFWVCFGFGYSHPSGCEVIFHCDFDLHYLNALHLLMCFLAILLEMSFQVLSLFFNWGCLSFCCCVVKSSLYILVTRPLSDI